MLVFEEGGPVEGDAGFPEFAGGGEEVGEVVAGRGKRGDDEAVAAGGMLAGEGAEGLAGADFEQDEIAGGEGGC